MDSSTLPDQVEYDSIDSTEHLGLRVLNAQSVLICLVSKTAYEEKLVKKHSDRSDKQNLKKHTQANML